MYSVVVLSMQRLLRNSIAGGHEWQQVLGILGDIKVSSFALQCC